jgi:hypothetical protein
MDNITENDTNITKLPKFQNPKHPCAPLKRAILPEPGRLDALRPHAGSRNVKIAVDTSK